MHCDQCGVGPCWEMSKERLQAGGTGSRNERLFPWGHRYECILPGIQRWDSVSLGAGLLQPLADTLPRFLALAVPCLSSSLPQFRPMSGCRLLPRAAVSSSRISSWSEAVQALAPFSSTRHFLACCIASITRPGCGVCVEMQSSIGKQRRCHQFGTLLLF